MRKILIVDNSVVILNILIDLFLEKNEFEIFTAKSFNEVQDLVEKNDFFIVVSNIVLPDALNGELLEIFKEKNIPTIILSSTIDSEFLKTLNDLKVIDYVLKDSIYGLETVYHLVDLISFMEDMEILLVEDSLSISAQMKDVIESLLLKVKVVKDGSEALEELEKNKNISMIISDYNMPEMNGLELTRNLRKDSKYSLVPIIIITTEDDKELKIKLFKNGANDFITKPVLEEELKSKILSVFTNIKRIEEIKSFNKIFDDNIIYSSSDAQGIIKSASTAFEKISGYTKKELIGKPHSILRDPEMPSSIYKEMWDTIQKGQVWKGEIRNLRKDKKHYWVSSVIQPVFDKNGQIVRYYAIRQDISDKKKIYELSITDGLTGLYNRRYFNEVANSFMRNPVRNTSYVSFLILDIDNFKKYNDTYGHQDGDDVLIKVSESLKSSFKRSNDLVFRLGGEEFGVLLTAKKIEDTITIVEKARKNIELLAIEHSKNPPLNVVTASFGLIIVCVDEMDDNLDIDFIYKRGDECLYKAKESGRNRLEHLII